ncbi:hypothetical protein PPERSA_00443 [Pseudocohnilembus persalinus]|uniref:Nucleosome assembly protein (NAP) n=1 Tax=Pseudocohnilembus persalinus TaxID=266149 RepID=A0A0V0R6V4_PSEPJ|nr:hypothetical protein PPERSA_00443 [Pseudocohnilembus persalinus]|eukprot:KRX10246.1 hypothetical protein PPERSA_00443 [Pseudocohnilembus persalinus]
MAEKSAQEQAKEEIIQKIKELDTTSKKYKTIALNHYLEQKKALDTQLEAEMKALTIKYEKLSEPIYEASQQIIKGERELKKEELSNMETILNDEEKAKLDEELANKSGIPGYWLTAFKNCEIILPEIKSKDEPLLEKITKIQYIPESDDGLKFKIIFTFAPNDYFENETLSKSFVLKDDDEPISGSGTEIQWKENKNITVKQVKKTQKNKKSGAKRVVTKEVEDESFFNFFKDAEQGEQEPEEDDEEAMAQEEKLAIDFDIARVLIDEIIPYSLEYYLGVKTGEDYDNMDFGDEDYDDEDEDDEDNQGQQNKKKTHKKSTDSTKSKGSNKGQEKPECKQQ